MSLKISKTNHEGFLKKWRNYGRTRPIGLLGSQTGDQKLTGYNVHVWKYTYIYICEHIYVDKNNYVYRLLPHFISVNSVCRDCLAFSTFVKCDILMLNHTTAFLFSQNLATGMNVGVGCALLTICRSYVNTQKMKGRFMAPLLWSDSNTSVMLPPKTYLC